MTNLLPGKTFKCIGSLEQGGQSFSISNHPLTVNTTKIKFTFTADAFFIKLFVDDKYKEWPLTFHFRKADQGEYSVQTFDPNWLSEILKIENLFMLSTYTVCLSISDEQCPRMKEKCQACEQITTLEDYPLNVTNLEFEESNTVMKITWQAPEFSGKIISYNTFLKGNCKIRDTMHCDKIGSRCKTFEHKTVLDTYANFNYNPYWNYEVFVSAINTKGSGNNVSSNYTTKKKEKIPQMDLYPQSKRILVTLKPDCLYSGPITYTIAANKTGARPSKIVFKRDVIYDVENSKYINNNVSLDNLEPITNYSVCITIMSTNIYPLCHYTMTSQHRPEGHPLLSTSIITESKIEFSLKRPKKAYALENEEIKYYIEIKAKCFSKDELCTKDINCLNETELNTKICTSSNYNFVCSFDDLQPYWQYQFRIQTVNNIGTGDWSNWTSWYLTSSISSENIETKAVDFSTDPQSNSITVYLHSYCPYPGNI